MKKEAKKKSIRLGLVATLILSIFLSSLMSPVFDTVSAADSGWWVDTNWDYCKLITINSTQVDATLTNFPILVQITSDSNLANNAQADGNDTLFTMNGNNETKLNHEIESWVDDGNYVNASIWVNITSLSSSTDTKIWMYYGNLTCGSQESVTGTWNSNFMMVQHMYDNTTSDILDSTSNNNDGAKKGANEPIENTSGKIGSSQQFDGNDYVNISDDNTLDFGTGAFTLECWMHTSTNAGMSLIQKNSCTPMYRVYTRTSDPYIRLQMLVSASNIFTTVQPVNVLDGSWHYVSVGRDGDNLLTYVDGYLKSTDAGAAGVNVDNANALLLGRIPGGGEMYTGFMDEVRISSVSRNSSWVNASYKTVNSPDTFLVVGSEQGNAGDRVNDDNEWFFALGDSITKCDNDHGGDLGPTAGDDADGFNNSGAYFMQMRDNWYPSLSIDGWGEGGHTSTNGLTQINSALHGVKSHNTYYFILYGANDIHAVNNPSTTATNILSMYNTTIDAGVTPIIANVLPMNDTSPYNAGNSNYGQAPYNHYVAIRDKCLEYSVKLIPLYDCVEGTYPWLNQSWNGRWDNNSWCGTNPTTPLTDKCVFDDAAHPNRTGHKLIGDMIHYFLEGWDCNSTYYAGNDTLILDADYNETIFLNMTANNSGWNSGNLVIWDYTNQVNVTDWYVNTEHVSKMTGTNMLHLNITKGVTYFISDEFVPLWDMNVAPTQSGEAPSNSSTDVSLLPSLYVICNDINSDTMTATWRSNSSGSWVTFATTTNIGTGTNITQPNSNFSDTNTTYWWSVNLTDNTEWCNETYHFTTGDGSLEPPSQEPDKPYTPPTDDQNSGNQISTTQSLAILLVVSAVISVALILFYLYGKR